jgi:putative signal transducing protein
MSDEPKIDGELVSVFDTEQESEAMVVQGLLTSVGIDSTISSLDAVQNIYPGVGGVQVRVNPAQVEQARQIIAEYATADVDVEEVQEEGGETPSKS